MDKYRFKYSPYIGTYRCANHTYLCGSAICKILRVKESPQEIDIVISKEPFSRSRQAFVLFTSENVRIGLRTGMEYPLYPYTEKFLRKYFGMSSRQIGARSLYFKITHANI